MTRQRNTVQKQIIFNAVKKLKTHPTIDEIFNEIHSKHPSISKATVYRNLRRLAANGMVRQVSLPDGLERYDCRTDRHYHFRCKNCGGIIDIDIEKDLDTDMDIRFLARINEAVQEKYGVQADEHDIVFSGVCRRCKG